MGWPEAFLDAFVVFCLCVIGAVAVLAVMNLDAAREPKKLSDDEDGT